jgi:hypothetical protein
MNDLQYFQLLKTALQNTLQASYPHFTRDIHEWKAQEITALQEALHQKVKGYVSEKWFYTHLKPTQNDKLPRIDMLDMLAQYIGYQNWQDFVYKSPNPQKERIEAHSLEGENILSKKRSVRWEVLRYWLLLPLGIGIFIFWNGTFANEAVLEFCFQDADTQKPITQELDVFLWQEKESPKLQKINKQGCMRLKSNSPTITLIVKAPYYKTDTIVRSVRQGQASEIIKLKKDDYALLIHLIAKHGTNETERNQKRKQLDRIIAHDAQIFQIDEDGLGLELYNKEEFIDKLALPVSSLKNLEIIETQYQKDKIVLLRFLQK